MKVNRIHIILCLLGLSLPIMASNISGNTEFLKRNYEGAIEEYKKKRVRGLPNKRIKRKRVSFLPNSFLKSRILSCIYCLSIFAKKPK